MKKKQNSLNVLFISKLNSELLYFSKCSLQPHDQKQWNNLDLRNLFEDKPYGILGDGGFTFNRIDDHVFIKGYRPILKPKGEKLTPEQKQYNKALSQMRVVIENVIRKVKRWKVIGQTYRHWHGNKGKLDINQIVCISATLSNRQILKTPLRSDDWRAPEWMEQMAPTVPLGPYPN